MSTDGARGRHDRRLPVRLADPALAELWARSWKAMARAGPDSWDAVTITMPLTDDDVRRAVAGLLGRRVRAGTAATRIGLHALDATLRRGGDGWDLRGVVEATDGPLPDRVGDARDRAAAIDGALASARATLADRAWSSSWVENLRDGTATRLHGRGELGLIDAAARVLAELPADGLPLPVLASRTTGDTKALGATTLGTLVLRGLARWFDEPMPVDAAGRRALWEAAGVVQDDLASQVLVLGLGHLGVASSPGPLGRWLTDATDEGLPFRVTLQQLTRHPLTVDGARSVFVCENPAVLRTAAAQLGARSAPLVCTEGRPSIACSRLLAMLVAGGCTVRYHGDFDWPGLHIAGAVLEATGGSAWRLGADDYATAVTRPRASPAALRGAPAPSPWDPELSRIMAAVGEVVYEEDVVDTLLGDLASDRRDRW